MCNACEIARLNKTGMEAFNQGRVEEAEEKLKRAINLAKDMGSKMYQAKILFNLSLVHQDNDRPASALTCLHLAKTLVNEQTQVPNRFTKRIQQNLNLLLAA